MKTGKKPVARRFIFFSLMLIISVLIKVASYFPEWIETHYSRGFYPYISRFYRIIFGWLPFSLGDILYTSAGIYILIVIVKFVKSLIKRQITKAYVTKTVERILVTAAVIYIYFNLSWGLNYNRPGIAYQLQLSSQEHTDAELKLLSEQLLKKVNESRQILGRQKVTIGPYQNVFNRAEKAYSSASSLFPFLTYQQLSVKRSLYGRVGNFLGFLGYYNPFTGEAQLNLTQPRFLVPYVTCHEMAHQLGYASESEANFVGYLAAVHSTDSVFHYSAYFDLFNYANSELYARDSIAAKENYKKLDPMVKNDEMELREYWHKSDNMVEPLIKLFYDHYLKANQQSKGVKSYNEVVDWMIAYYNKYGTI